MIIDDGKIQRFKILFPLSPPFPRTSPFFYNSVLKKTKKPSSSTENKRKKPNALPDIFNSFYFWL
jgi:hypothetical protein